MPLFLLINLCPKGRLALLYLIGKPKSQVPVEVLRRPIAAAAAPVISRQCLRVAARAFTLFVRTLASEIPGAFVTLRLQEMGTWLKKLGGWGAEFIGEADCKEQFNVIPPSSVIKHMREVAVWLTTRRRWRASTLVWSIHKTSHMTGWVKVSGARSMVFQCKNEFHWWNSDCPRITWWWQLGNCGGAPVRYLWVALLARKALTSVLYSMWCCKLTVDLLRKWGQFSKTDDGIVQWFAWGTIFALQQFRDNLVVA